MTPPKIMNRLVMWWSFPLLIVRNTGSTPALSAGSGAGERHPRSPPHRPRAPSGDDVRRPVHAQYTPSPAPAAQRRFPSKTTEAPPAQDCRGQPPCCSHEPRGTTARARIPSGRERVRVTLQGRARSHLRFHPAAHTVTSPPRDRDPPPISNGCQGAGGRLQCQHR